MTASILAPIYVVYTTTVFVGDGQVHEPQFSFESPEEYRKHASKLAALVERELSFQPCPLRFAGVTVPGLRVTYLHSDRAPTLLEALFDTALDNLP